MDLSLGPGDGLRLLAPGQPDWIGADGERLGWAVRDRLFLLRGDRVAMVTLPDLVEEVHPDPEGWVVALGQGFVRVDPARAEITAVIVDEDADPVTTHAGRDVGLLVEVPEHRVFRLADARPIPIPDGAASARFVRPWARGHGLVWVSGDTLYRLGERTAALGRAPGAEGIAAGPDGAVLVSLKADTVVAAPRGLAVRVGEHVEASTARFSPDGREVVAACEDGAVRIELATGKVVERWDGSLLPVGRLAGWVFLDATRGAVVDGGGAVLAGGFGGARAARSGGTLAGPGGAVWTLPTRARREAGLFEGLAGTDGHRVVHVVGGQLRLDGGVEVPHGLEDDGDEVVVVKVHGAEVVLTTLDGEQAKFDGTTGAQRERTHVRPPRLPGADLCAGAGVSAEGEDSEVRVGDAAWPIPADGVAVVPGGHWAWTREGMLVQLPG